MRVLFSLVDVFTDRPLAGNQLCVIPEGSGLAGHEMQAIASEIAFSETAFVTEVARDRYWMRIFTPATEIPFAGHPSLGTAFVLASEGRVAPLVTQVVRAGEFRMEVDEAGSVRMRQLPPKFGPAAQTPEVPAAIGLRDDDLRHDLPPQVVDTGLPHLMVAARDADAVGRAAPDSRRLATLLERFEAGGYYLFALGRNGAKARMFAPGVGVAEDAATGSAAGPLGCYLVQHGVLPPGRIAISQGVELRRPSTLVVDVRRGEAGWEVWVSGGVVKVGEGFFEVPP